MAMKWSSWPDGTHLQLPASALCKCRRIVVRRSSREQYPRLPYEILREARECLCVANLMREDGVGCPRLILKIGIVAKATGYPALHRSRARSLRSPSAIVVAIVERNPS